jgi:hypothetical protein
MFGAVTGRIQRARVAAGRATMAPLLVRVGIFGCGALAMLVAYPTDVTASQLVALLLVVAALPAFAPRGRAGSIAAIAAIYGWVLDTTYYDAPVVLWRVLTLATALYLAHTLTALAAVLPYDATVDLDVVTRWLGSAFAVALGSAVLIVFVLALTADLAGPAFIAATLVGLAAAIGVAALLASLLRRA